MQKPNQTQAEIHEFNGSTFDDEGEVMLGFYFRFTDQHDVPITLLMGPYTTAIEAETACQDEFNLM